MVAVQIPFVKKLQTKLQETYDTILKYKNEITIVPSFVFMGLFLRPCCFRKEVWNLNILSCENHHYITYLNFGRQLSRWNFKVILFE